MANRNDVSVVVPPEDPAPPPAAPAAAVPAPAPAEPEDGMAAFVVTNLAGPRINGEDVRPQQKIRMTEAQAEHLLLSGAIVREGEKLHEALKGTAVKAA